MFLGMIHVVQGCIKMNFNFNVRVTDRRVTDRRVPGRRVGVSVGVAFWFMGIGLVVASGLPSMGLG